MTGPSFAIGRPLGAVLVFCGLLLAALTAVGASWAGLSAATEERDAKAELLARGAAASRRASAGPATPAADPFVSAATATLAAAAVDAGLRSLATASGLALLSNRADVAPEEPPAAAGVAPTAGIGTRIEDHAVLEGSNEAVRSLLIRLDAGTPAVLVDDLAIEPAASGEGGMDAPAPRLRVTLTLSAWWRPQGGG